MTEPRRVLTGSHPRIAELLRLARRGTSRSAEVLIEGPRTIIEALEAGLIQRSVIVAESAESAPAVSDVLARVCSTGDVEVLVVRDAVFAKLARTVTPQPLLGVVQRRWADLPGSIGETDVWLVLVGVGDPGNVGTLVRSAHAFGAAGVVVVGGADPWGPKAVRASAGSVLRMKLVSDSDVVQPLEALRRAGARIVATDVRNGLLSRDNGVLRAPVAIVLGPESAGLNRSISASVDAWCRIDMPGGTESLNVAMAGTLLLYETLRRVV